jgi:D(-)-tartrate dehydratase
MKITAIREVTQPISSKIRNAYIDFSKMTLSLVAVVTDVLRDGRPLLATASTRTAVMARAG